MSKTMNNQYNPFLDKMNKLKESAPQRPPSLDELEPMVCPKCGNSIFDRYFKMFKLSALKTASGKEQHFNVPVYVCASCAEILDLSNSNESPEEDSTKDINKEEEKEK